MENAHLAFTGFDGKRLHLGVSGSISAYRAPDLLRMWIKAGAPVGVTVSEGGSKFVSALTFAALGAKPVLTNMFTEGPAGLEDHEIFAHLLPGQTSQALVIAPASAAVIARIARGMGDELLACQALAFSGPVVLAPAMNPRMWSNPATRENVDILVKRGCRIVAPDTGSTACGEEGQGKLADLRHIFLHGLRALTPQSLAGKRALVTIGPTAEPWDGIRVWTNRSSGIMGASLALALWMHGCRVTAVCGPGVPWLPPEIERVSAHTAQEMYEECDAIFGHADIAVFAAAVADFAPEKQGGAKFKKNGALTGFSIQFGANPDIFATLSRRKREGQLLVGFAAESENLLDNMRTKLTAKHADILVGNLIGSPDAAFGAPTNRVTLLDADGNSEELPLMSKPDAAWKIVEWLLRR